MWIRRELTKPLEKLTSHYPVLVLTGPRQVGKTSLLEKAFPNCGYASLDFVQTAEQARTSPAEFLRDNPPPVIIDEIQYSPTLLKHIKASVDRQPNMKGAYLLTGSQSFPLMQAVSESLAGRAAVVSMLSLGFDEWRAGSGTVPEKDRLSFLFRGGFPALWNQPEDPVDRVRWYQSYTATYLERDIRNILNVGSLRDFNRFIRACAIRTGQLLNMSDMGRDVGVSANTVKKWLSVLEASGTIYLLEPYHSSMGKRIVKTPKLYFTDTGLAAFLCGYSSADALRGSHQIGAFWENHVVTQWLRWKNNHHPEAALWFWQDRIKNEVDLLIEKDGLLHQIECKWKEVPDRSDLKGIRKFRDTYPDELLGNAFIACNTPHSFDLAPGVKAVDGWSPGKLM